MQTFDFSLLDLPVGFAPGGQGRRLRGALAGVAGLTMDSASEGRFEIAGRIASVTNERGDGLRIALPVDQPQTPREMLTATRQLPGNVRFAVVKGQVALLADTQLDGAAHLSETIRRIGGGLSQGVGRVSDPSVLRDADGLNTKQIDQVLSKSTLDAESLVRLEHGWELRPKLHGEPTAVQASIDENKLGSELRLHHELLSIDEDYEGWNAAAHQALRFNSRLRHARLAADGRRIVAETRLHGGQVQPACLLSAARAVAAAARHCRTALLILAEQPEVAKQYEEMFWK